MRNLLVMACVFLVFLSCAQLRIRTPSLEEKRNFVFSQNLDRAILDPLELGPTQMIPVLAGDGEDPRSTPLSYMQRQHELVQGDLIRAGYDDFSEDGTSTLSGEEKSSAVLIGVIIVVLVLAGASVPLLIALDVI